MAQENLEPLSERRCLLQGKKFKNCSIYPVTVDFMITESVAEKMALRKVISRMVRAHGSRVVAASVSRISGDTVNGFPIMPIRSVCHRSHGGGLFVQTLSMWPFDTAHHALPQTQFFRLPALDAVLHDHVVETRKGYVDFVRTHFHGMAP